MIIGSGSVILPGVILETGVAVGALSLVNKIVQSLVFICQINIYKALNAPVPEFAHVSHDPG